MCKPSGCASVFLEAVPHAQLSARALAAIEGASLPDTATTLQLLALPIAAAGAEPALWQGQGALRFGEPGRKSSAWQFVVELDAPLVSNASLLLPAWTAPPLMVALYFASPSLS